MQDYQTYLIVFMAGIILGGFGGLFLNGRNSRRMHWEYQNPAFQPAYEAYARSDAHFWPAVFVGLFILGLLLIIAQGADL